MRRETLDSLANALAMVAERHGLDCFDLARRVLNGFRDPGDAFAERIVFHITNVVSEVDDQGGGRDLYIDVNDARGAWVKLMREEMCRETVRLALEQDLESAGEDLDVAVASAMEVLCSPPASLVDEFCSVASQMVETWDYRPVEQVSISPARVRDDWKDLMFYLTSC